MVIALLGLKEYVNSEILVQPLGYPDRNFPYSGLVTQLRLPT